MFLTSGLVTGLKRGILSEKKQTGNRGKTIREEVEAVGGFLDW